MRKMIAIIDYGVGNIFSLASTFKMLGKDVILTNDPQKIKDADRLILPGVGAFADAAKKLKESGMFDLLKEQARSGKALLGICLGMQLLFDKSYEFGETDGLGLISGSVRPISESIEKNLKIPHIGWNSLTFPKKSQLFKNTDDGEFVYFVHSYQGTDCEKSTIAYSSYGGTITAAVAEDNVFGTQFHPEKSGETGLKILSAFCDI